MPGVPRGGGDSRPPTGSRGECALTTGLTHDPASRTTVPRVTAHGCLLPTSRCAGARRAVVLHQAQTKPIGSGHTDPREPPQHLLRTGGSMGTCCCLTKGTQWQTDQGERILGTGPKNHRRAGIPGTSHQDTNGGKGFSRQQVSPMRSLPHGRCCRRSSGHCREVTRVLTAGGQTLTRKPNNGKQPLCRPTNKLQTQQSAGFMDLFSKSKNTWTV